MLRLKEVLKSKGITARALAEQIHVAESTMSLYVNGKRQPDYATLKKISAALNVSTDFLIDNAPSPSKHGVLIPVYGRVVAGIPIEAITDIEDYEEIDEAMATQGEYFALKIHGTSMEPRFSEGDVVIVRKQEYIDSGDVAIVMINGDEATCKRIKKTPEGVFLISTNPAFDPMFYNNKQIEELPVRILGKVVELRAKF